MRAARVVLGLATASAVAACAIDISGTGVTEETSGGHDSGSDATMIDAPTGDDAPSEMTDGAADDDAPNGDDASEDAATDASDASDADAADSAPVDAGPPVLNCDGGPCYALQFDGGGYVETALLPASGSFTLEAFVKPTMLTASTDVTAGNFIIATNDSETKNSYWVDLYKSGILSASIGSSAAGGYVAAEGTSALATGTWAHVAVTRDLTAMPPVVTSYVDGKLYASVVGGNDAGLTDIFEFAVGQRFVGVIDDVRVWNFSRTAAQVALDAVTVNEPPNSGGGLVLYWSFDDGPGSGIANDTSGTMPANYGAFMGGAAPLWVISDRPTP